MGVQTQPMAISAPGGVRVTVDAGGLGKLEFEVDRVIYADIDDQDGRIVGQVLLIMEPKEPNTSGSSS